MSGRLRVYNLRQKRWATRLAPIAFWTFYVLLPVLFVAACLWIVHLRREAENVEKVFSDTVDSLDECRGELQKDNGDFEATVRELDACADGLTDCTRRLATCIGVKP